MAHAKRKAMSPIIRKRKDAEVKAEDMHGDSLHLGF